MQPACNWSVRLHDIDQTAATLIMVRTQCCEGYKTFGTRCAICPNRPENREAVQAFKRDSRAGLGCRIACSGGCTGSCGTGSEPG